ncbi:MAG: LytTR family transcriptional regulator DNA-binding domain-containing protein [Alphaproteobacteria bacterium]|nr:LytTR family transcriptional regulator DNA-binding domain-containing protein [Alphaproteobacteria bacterium]
MTPGDLLSFWGTKDPKTEIKKTLLMAGFGLMLSFIAPYGTNDMPLGFWRIIYWVSLLMFGSLVSGPIARWSMPWLSGKLAAAPLLLLGYSAILSVPVFLAVIFTDINFHSLGNTGKWPTLAYAEAFLAATAGSVYEVMVWYAKVVIITYLAIGCISMLINITKPKPEPGQEPVGPPPGYLFLRRLPTSIGQDLLCLQMEDHYVRAYTANGDALVRMRLKDAVAELDGFGGAQVHRSWWVALRAIESVKRDGRRHLIHLKGGIKVPVSKTFSTTLKEHGYL